MLTYGYPYLAYLFWATCYYQFNFVWRAKKIRQQQYGTLYMQYAKISWSKALMEKFGPDWSPLIFMAAHCSFFSVGHTLAVLSYYNSYIATMLMFGYVGTMIWNGSSHYA
jgi:hypothetical protein